MTNLRIFLKNNLNIRHMRLLIALDDHRSVVKAATYLNLTQPAISKALAGLEQGIGAPLFRRAKSGLVPTDAGGCLIRHSRRVMIRIEQAERELEEILFQGSSHISIGTLPATAVYLIPAFIARLESELPNTTVSLREGTMDSLLPALKTGQIDFAVGLLGGPQMGPEFETEILFTDPVVAAARRGHPLTSRERIAWEELQGYPLVLPPATTLARGAIEAMFMNRRIPITKNRVDSVSTMANVGTLQVTDAIGFLSRSLVAHFARLGVLEPLPLELPPDVNLSIGMVRIADRDRTEAHIMGHRLLVETARALSAAAPNLLSAS